MNDIEALNTKEITACIAAIGLMCNKETLPAIVTLTNKLMRLNEILYNVPGDYTDCKYDEDELDRSQDALLERTTSIISDIIKEGGSYEGSASDDPM